MDNTNIMNCKDKKRLKEYFHSKMAYIFSDCPKFMKLKPKVIPDMVVPYKKHGDIFAILIEENGKVDHYLRTYIDNLRGRKFHLMDEFFEYYCAGYEFATSDKSLIVPIGQYLVYCDGELRKLTYENIKRYYHILQDTSSMTEGDHWPKMYCKNHAAGEQPIIMY